MLLGPPLLAWRVGGGDGDLLAHYEEVVVEKRRGKRRGGMGAEKKREKARGEWTLGNFQKSLAGIITCGVVIDHRMIALPPLSWHTDSNHGALVPMLQRLTRWISIAGPL